ncbi:MAG: MFS transporter [Acidobacteriota bacterium]
MAQHPEPGSRRQKFVLIGSLYMAQAIPVGFLVVAMPVILRLSGLSLERVGLFSAIALPWIFKFLWAPWLDRWGSVRRGHYRSWILPLQGLSVLTVASLAWWDLEHDLLVIVGLSAFYMVLSATQDIATDGLSVRILTAEERGPGNGLQVAGYYLGQVFGSGGVLAIFALFGWAPAVLTMAAVLAIPMLLVGRFDEPPFERPDDAAPPSYGAMARFVGRAGGLWVFVLMLFRGGEAMATYVYNQMLVGRVDVVDIGVISGGLYAVGALIGATWGGVRLVRIGRRNALVRFGIIQSAALSLYVLPAIGMGGTTLLYAAPAIVGFAGGLATAALYTAMMDHSQAATAGTDFTLQQALAAVGPLVGTIASGFVAGSMGFAGHFLICGGLAALAALVATQARLATVG